MKKFFGIALLFMVFLTLALRPTLAKETSNTAPATDKKSTEERREEVKKNKCDMVEARIDERISKFDSNKARHVTQYNQISVRVSNIVEKLEAKGIDVSELKEDLSVLDGKIQNFANDYKAFIEALRETKNHACGESDGEFKNKIKEAEEKLKAVKENVADIRDYIQNTIKPDIEALKGQIKTERKENTERKVK